VEQRIFKLSVGQQFRHEGIVYEKKDNKGNCTRLDSGEIFRLPTMQIVEMYFDTTELENEVEDIVDDFEAVETEVKKETPPDPEDFEDSEEES